MQIFRVKRIYEPVTKLDGVRILIDRLWPRGIKKEVANIDYWIKELAPPRELLIWFHEKKDERFNEFEKKYFNYLKNTQFLLLEIKNKKTVTLVTAVKDINHSHIPSLLKFLSK